MIAAAELRKGNYVLYNTLGSVPLADYRFEKAKELCRVRGFEEDKIVVSFLDESIQAAFSAEVHTAAINLSPIRLTQEIVESCRFANDHFELTDAADGFCYQQKVLHYLHQLQNTYFDATGAELHVDL